MNAEPNATEGRERQLPLAARLDEQELARGPLRELSLLAQGRVGRIPVELFVRHAARVAADGDEVLQRETMLALLRRVEFMERDRLRVARTPEDGSLYGEYRTRRERMAERPYRTLLHEIQPLRGSCDCPDYTRASLGLCKHMVTVLEHLARRPRRLEGALLGERELYHEPRLEWDPVRPLFGRGDWLERVRFSPGSGPRAPRVLEKLEPWFDAGVGQAYVLRSTFSDEPEQRLELVEALRRAVRRRGQHAPPIDPALDQLLGEERERLKRRLGDRAGVASGMRTLKGLRRKLYAYQVQAVEHFLERGRLLLADDMGLGKTTQAVAACHALFAEGRVRRALLIVPASLKDQWLREWQATTDTPALLVDGTPEQRAQIYRSTRRGALIANYEQCLRDLELMADWKAELVVLDEAQRIKNWATRTAACVKSLQPTWRLVLTGTPMENRLEELASIVEWVDDRALEPIWRLSPFHTQREEGRTVGARHLDVLRERIEHCTMRRQRREILDQLPERTDTLVPVGLTSAQREAHDDLARPIASLMQRSERRALSRPEFLRLMGLLTTQRVISNGMAQLEFPEVWPGLRALRNPDDTFLASLSSPKLGELRELVRQIVLAQGRKLVVFSQWRRMLDLAHWAIAGMLDEAGLRAVRFSGAESRRQRERSVSAMHEDEATRVLLATDAGGVGLNLQRAATACICLDVPWNPAVFEQRVARIHRLGQTQPIDVFSLVSQDCIEARIHQSMGSKQALFDGLFDGETDAVTFADGGSFLKSVRRLLGEESEASAPQGGAVEENPAERRAVDALLEAADEHPEETAPEPAVPTGPEVGALLSSIRVRKTPDGGLSLEAPPEAAGTLAGLFQGLGELLARAASPPTDSEPGDKS